jgi:DASS family divalent anion:Na+ symporter
VTSTAAPPLATDPVRSTAGKWIRWGLVGLAAAAVLIAPNPEGIDERGWGMCAVFAATMVGLIVQPLSGGAVVLLGVAASTLFGVLTPAQALAGYADPLVWMVFSAFMIARGMIKTGLGRRIALRFVRFLGHTSLGLAYALAFTDGLLATVIPSNSARAGGILFPLTKSISESYDSRPGPSATLLGAFLIPLIYQIDVLMCGMFLTGQAANALIAGFALEQTGIQITYATWALGAIAPGLVVFTLMPLLVYRVFPPEIKKTPDAAAYAHRELESMGPMTRHEWVMLGVFTLVFILWLTRANPADGPSGLRFHTLDYPVVALLGLSALVVTGVLDWDDVRSDKGAWDVFIWYGGLIGLARALTETGVPALFAQATGGALGGISWPVALTALLLVYFYAHYAFASITAHATAMYIPFLLVAIAAGAPPLLAALTLVYFSNLCACLTHYGTTPAPIYYGANYVTQARWWTIGLMVSVLHVLSFTLVGGVWWKVLGWW